MKNLVILVNFNKPESLSSMKILHEWAEKNGVNLFMLESEGMPDGSTAISDSELSALKADETLIVAFGGDGTMLHTAKIAFRHNLRLAGINLGSLGFLSEIRYTELAKRLDMIMKGEFTIEERIMVDASYEGETLTGLNDIVLLSREIRRMVKIGVYLNNKEVMTISADGIIISTPTGSTAYSMSAGGPIVMPDVPCFLLTPICPHLLVQKPMVLSQNSLIRLVPRSGGAVLSADSQSSIDIDRDGSITVKRCPGTLKLVKFRDIDFLSIMREKFYLGKDPRK